MRSLQQRRIINFHMFLVGEGEDSGGIQNIEINHVANLSPSPSGASVVALWSSPWLRGIGLSESSPRHQSIPIAFVSLVCLSVALLVTYIPTKGFKEGIEKLPPKLGLVVLTRPISLTITIESLDWFKYFFRDCYFFLASSSFMCANLSNFSNRAVYPKVLWIYRL